METLSARRWLENYLWRTERGIGLHQVGHREGHQ